MTLDEFLVKLRETPRDWYLTEQHCIRRDPPEAHCCPITACDLQGPSDACKWPEVADYVLCLPYGVAQDIVDSADFVAGHDPALRAKLLAACGLTPEPPR